MSTPRLVEFSALPHSTRERLVAATRGHGRPEPILSNPLTLGQALGACAVMLLVGAGALALLVVNEFGRSTEWGLQPASFAAAYVVGSFLCIFAALHVVKRRQLLRSLPFAPGRYVFPVDFVDARTNPIVLIPMGSLLEFRGVHHHTNGVYTNTVFTLSFEGGRSESMSVRGKALAESILAELRASRYALAEAVEARDVDRLHALDLFFEARMMDFAPVGDDGIPSLFVARPLPALLRFGWLVALVVALPLGVSAWALRNRASDDTQYAELAAAAEAYEVESYVSHGGRHAAEATSELLPRIALRKATEAGSVTAFRELAKAYPEHAVAAKAREEIARLYRETLAHFHARAADDPAMRAFVERLFEDLRARDSSTVFVRFGKPTATELAKADEILSKKVPGGVVPIAGHFTDASSAPREDAIVASLQEAFRESFPADMLTLQKASPLTSDAPPPPGPVLGIAYAVKPSGATYKSDRTQKQFVGIVIDFDVKMRVPGDAKPFETKLTVEPPERFSVEYSSTFGEYAGPDDGKVYHAMATHAFEQLRTKLHAVFFKQPALGTPEPDAAPAGGRPTSL